MIEQFQEVEFETRTIGPLVLTAPVLQSLGFRGIVNCYCPIAEQANLDHGLVAELVTQSRLSDPRALYDLVDWAARYAIPELYPEVERAEQLNDDRVGRTLDAIYDQRALIWGELVAKAAQRYELDLRRLHADTMAITFAGLFADQPEVKAVPHLEPGYNPQGEWAQQLKLFALAAGDGGLPVWFDALDGGTGDSTTYLCAPVCGLLRTCPVGQLLAFRGSHSHRRRQDAHGKEPIDLAAPGLGVHRPSDDARPSPPDSAGTARCRPNMGRVALCGPERCR